MGQCLGLGLEGLMHTTACYIKLSFWKLERKYSLESTDPRESEIRAPPQPLPYLMPISPNTLFYDKKFITAFLSL